MGAKRSFASNVSGKHHHAPPTPTDLHSTLDALLEEIAASAQYLADKTDFNEDTHSVAAAILRFSGRASALLGRNRPKNGARLPVVVPIGGGDREEQDAAQSSCILVIDDEETVRSVTRQFIEVAGCRVIVAAGGREGLALFEQHRAEISGVLLDIMMPPMNGNLVFARLRAIDPTVPVVAMSGNPDPHVLAQMTSAGLNGFLPKPFTPEAFFKVIELIRDKHAERLASSTESPIGRALDEAAGF